MNPIQGLHYKLAELRRTRGVKFIKANHPDTLPAEAHELNGQVSQIDQEIALTERLIAGDMILVECIENLANSIEREKVITAPRRQAINRLRTTADGLRRELGDLPPPPKP